MYQVIIVDDERNIREGITDLVDWRELGCEVTASFRNGEQVLEFLKESRKTIHIVITDIKMPVMDGMELSGVLHEKYPEIKVIILTAYSDFTYAQRAIKYQVSDFVVKNEFLEELPKAVRRAIQKLDREKSAREEEISGFGRGTGYRVCACEVKSDHQISLKQNKKSLEDLLNSSVGSQGLVLMLNDENSFYFVAQQPKGGGNWSKEELLRRLEKFLALANTFLQIQIRVGVSAPVEDMEHFSKGRQQALRNLANIYKDEYPVALMDEIAETKQLWTDDWDIDGYMRNLYMALRGENKEEQDKLYMEFQAYLKEPDRPLEQCKADTHAITSYLHRKVRGMESEDGIFNPESLLKATYIAKTKASLWDVMMKVCSDVYNMLQGNSAYQNVLVKNVDDIIRKEYQEKLSLKVISQKLYVNSSYLSRIYKKETKITITDAINKYRIKKAKEILDKKEHKVYEVGRMVGIEDPAYFTHVFLKYEGETPSDYMTR